MSLVKIYTGFDAEIKKVTPLIDTVHQGGLITYADGTTKTGAYAPVIDKPYQELFILPAIDETDYLSNDGYLSRGLFQITLRYPNNKKLGEVFTKIEQYKSYFKDNNYFVSGGLKVNIQSNMSVNNLGSDGDRLIYVIRLPFKCLVEM